MSLTLPAGLQFKDLYDDAGLARVDALFLDRLGAHDPALAGRLSDARRAVSEGTPPSNKDEATLLIDLAPRVDAFVAELFGIGEALADLKARHHDLEPLYQVKWKFVKRQAMLKVKPEELEGFDHCLGSPA